MHRFKHRVAVRLGDPIVYDFAQEAPKTVGAPHQIPANSVAVQFLMKNASPDASVT